MREERENVRKKRRERGKEIQLSVLISLIFVKHTYYKKRTKDREQGWKREDIKITIERENY